LNWVLVVRCLKYVGLSLYNKDVYNGVEMTSYISGCADTWQFKQAIE